MNLPSSWPFPADQREALKKLATVPCSEVTRVETKRQALTRPPLTLTDIPDAPY